MPVPWPSRSTRVGCKQSQAASQSSFHCGPCSCSPCPYSCHLSCHSFLHSSCPCCDSFSCPSCSSCPYCFSSSHPFPCLHYSFLSFHFLSCYPCRSFFLLHFCFPSFLFPSCLSSPLLFLHFYYFRSSCFCLFYSFLLHPCPCPCPCSSFSPYYSFSPCLYPCPYPFPCFCLFHHLRALHFW